MTGRVARETVPAALDGERVDRVVAIVTGLPRREVAALVAAGAVRLGGETVAARSQRVREGDEVEVDVPEPVSPAVVAEPAVEFAIVHADDDVIVVDKPPGLVVHPGSGHRTGTLAHGLVGRFPEVAGVGEPERPGIVHRLDAGTSGLLVVARTADAYASLVDQLSARTVERVYVALVWGTFDAPAGLVDAPIGRSPTDPTRMAIVADGRPARTAYTVVETFTAPADVSLLECRLETGRTHQIRVHLSAVDHPVVGDAAYGGVRPQISVDRPFLHAARLSFDHPGTGRRCSFESPLPPDLEAVHERLT